ncbi:MAG: Uncharacterized protein XE08_0201 [Parcubacteria bacterium 32_520]|nr:MAG: Uncharacterized protein XE08_0201 [Parcubacteria bacterium 32_520]
MKPPKVSSKVRTKIEDLNKQIQKLNDKRPVLEDELLKVKEDIKTLKTEIGRLKKLSKATGQSKYKNELERLTDKLLAAENRRAALIKGIDSIPDRVKELQGKINEIQHKDIMAYAMRLQSYLWVLRSTSIDEGRDMSKKIEETKQALNTTPFFDAKGQTTHHISVALKRIDRGELT